MKLTCRGSEGSFDRFDNTLDERGLVHPVIVHKQAAADREDHQVTQITWALQPPHKGSWVRQEGVHKFFFDLVCKRANLQIQWVQLPVQRHCRTNSWRQSAVKLHPPSHTHLSEVLHHTTACPSVTWRSLSWDAGTSGNRTFGANLPGSSWNGGKWNRKRRFYRWRCVTHCHGSGTLFPYMFGKLGYILSRASFGWKRQERSSSSAGFDANVFLSKDHSSARREAFCVISTCIENTLLKQEVGSFVCRHGWQRNRCKCDRSCSRRCRSSQGGPPPCHILHCYWWVEQKTLPIFKGSQQTTQELSGWVELVDTWESHNRQLSWTTMRQPLLDPSLTTIHRDQKGNEMTWFDKTFEN